MIRNCSAFGNLWVQNKFWIAPIDRPQFIFITYNIRHSIISPQKDPDIEGYSLNSAPNSIIFQFQLRCKINEFSLFVKCVWRGGCTPLLTIRENTVTPGYLQLLLWAAAKGSLSRRTRVNFHPPPPTKKITTGTPFNFNTYLLL